MVKKDVYYLDQDSHITLHIGGKYVDEPLQRKWKNQLKNYDLDNVELKIVNLSSKELDEAALLNELLENNDQKFNSISEERDLYKDKLQKIAQSNLSMDNLDKRVHLHFPSLSHFAYGQAFENRENAKDTIYTFFFSWDSTVTISSLNGKNVFLEEFVLKELQLLKSKDSLNVRLINY